MQRKICPTCNASYPARVERCPEDGALLENHNRPGSPLTAGRLVAGKYVIFSATGSNQVTSTYRVRSLDADEVRTLRVLQPSFEQEKAAAEAFRRTARVLRDLHHPNLVPVESTGDAEDGTPYLVTEVIAGRSLEEIIRLEAPLSPRRVCSIARQIAAGLDAAHRRGLLHLGLNPSVIFVEGPPEDEKVKVEDFGAAYARLGRTSNGRSPRALSDLIPANALYCSPEQALGRHSEGFDARADLYSLGVIIFEMLTGKTAFPGAVAGSHSGVHQQLATLVAQLEEPVLPPKLESADIPQPLASLLTQLLEKRPQLRPPTAQDVVERIGLVEQWIASRALMGLSARRVSIRRDEPLEDVASEPPGSEMPGVLLIQERTPPEPPPVAPQAIPETGPVLAEADSAPVPAPVSLAEAELAGNGRAEATDSPSAPAHLPTDWTGSSAVLFKAQPTAPPRQPRKWARLAPAALIVLVMAAGAWFLITHGIRPGPGPLSPVKSDEVRTPEGQSSSAGANVQSQEPQQSPTQAPASGVSRPQSTTGAAQPARSTVPPGTQSAAGSSSGPTELNTDVQHAIAAGDVFFEQGKYNLAIQAYAQPLKLDPTNKRLLGRIARARKAKAAEEQYLGQP